MTDLDALIERTRWALDYDSRFTAVSTWHDLIRDLLAVVEGHRQENERQRATSDAKSEHLRYLVQEAVRLLGDMPAGQRLRDELIRHGTEAAS